METGDESATACFIACSLFVKNAAFCEGLRLTRSSLLHRLRSFSERFGLRMIMSENLQNEQSSCSFSRDSKISNYEFVLQKHCDYRLEKQTIMLRSVPQTLKKWRIAVNRIPKVRQTTCNWIKKILGEATRIVNVFLISWFFSLFLLCSISLLVKYDFILRYEAQVIAMRMSSFIENFPQISKEPIAFQQNLLGKLSRNRPFCTNRFSAELASKIPAKSAVFFRKFVPENPAKFDFFSRDLPEALL